MLGAKKGPEVEQTLTFTCRSVDSSVILSIRIGEVSDAMRLRVGALGTGMRIQHVSKIQHRQSGRFEIDHKYKMNDVKQRSKYENSFGYVSESAKKAVYS